MDKYTRQLETAVTALKSPTALSRLHALYTRYQKGTLISDMYLEESRVSYVLHKANEKKNKNHKVYVCYTNK